jgi:hypothetical protein
LVRGREPYFADVQKDPAGPPFGQNGGSTAVRLERGPVNLGGSLRRHRTAKGLTQQEVAHPYYSHAYISTIEAGTDNRPKDGWTQLYNDLNSNSSTSQSLEWSTDIQWGP